QAGDLLGGILQVGAQGDHHPAPGGLEAGEDGRVLDEVTVKPQGPEVLRIALVKFREDFPGAVSGAVVHQDDLEGPPHAGEGAHQALPQLPQVLFLIVNGNNDGNIRFRRSYTQWDDLLGHMWLIWVKKLMQPQSLA